MSVEVRMPPWPLAIPALVFLAYETLRFVTAPNAATALRAFTVAILVIGVLRGHFVALSILALVNLYAALLFAAAIFGSTSSGHAIASMYAALMAAAFLNAGYLFFDQSQRDTATSELEP